MTIKKTVIAYMIVASCIEIFTGCATIFTGTKQKVHFNSEPQGARVIVNGIEMGKTPTSLDINKPGFATTSVTLRLEGHEERTFLLDKSFNAVSILNFLLIVPWFVDIATGAFMNYSPQHYDYALTKKKRAELKEHLGVDEIILSSSLKESNDGLIVKTSNNAQNKIAVLDEKTGHVLVLQ